MTASHWVCSSSTQDQIGLTLPALAAAGPARRGSGGAGTGLSNLLCVCSVELGICNPADTLPSLLSPSMLPKQNGLSQ